MVMIFADMSAQNNQLLHFMNMSQNHLVNPALKSSGSSYIGLPVISGISMNINNNFVSFSDIFMKSRTGDSVISILDRRYNIDNFLSKINDSISIEPQFSTQLFSVGFAVGNDGYVFLDITERVEGNIILPGTMFALVLKGNKQFLGKKIDLSSLRGDLVYYREVGLGLSKNLTSKFRIGVKGKLLFGIAGLSIDNRSFDISVNNNYLLNLDADATFNFSAPLKIDLYPDSTIRNIIFDKNRFKTPGGTYDFFSGKDNMGLGLDFGATYDISSKLMVSAAVTDIGFINWKKDVSNLVLKSKFEFGGLNIADVINGTRTFEDLGNELTDSLNKAFSFTCSNNQYTEHLPYSVNLGASYNFTKSISLGLLSYRRILNQQVHKSLSFSANVNLSSAFSSSLSYTISNYQIDHLGAGIAFRTGIFQFYILSSRIPIMWDKIRIDKTSTIIIPSNWNIINIRLGMNLVFGDAKKKADKPMMVVE